MKNKNTNEKKMKEYICIKERRRKGTRTNKNTGNKEICIQGDFESCADILFTSYWLHVELGKNFEKIQYFIKRTRMRFPCFKAYFQ
jgi:hypothetical protein